MGDYPFDKNTQKVEFDLWLAGVPVDKCEKIAKVIREAVKHGYDYHDTINFIVMDTAIIEKSFTECLEGLGKVINSFNSEEAGKV